jgi:hypothetical protein
MCIGTCQVVLGTQLRLTRTVALRQRTAKIRAVGAHQRSPPARLRAMRSRPGSPGTGPGTRRRSERHPGRPSHRAPPDSSLATRSTPCRASLPQKLHRASDSDASSRSSPSAQPLTGALADSRVASATHRSQMNTPGPAISCAHSSCERPQNEHGPGGPAESVGADATTVGLAASSMIWWTRWWLSRKASAISRSDPPAACSRRMARW